MAENIEHSMNKEINELFGRVSGVEKDVSNLSHQVSDLQKALSVGLARIEENFDKLAISKQTNWSSFWGTFTGIGALVVTIIIALGTLSVAPISSRTMENRDAIVAHQKLEGHPTSVAKFEALQKEFNTYRATQTKLSDTDKEYLRRELDLRKEFFLTLIADLRRDLEYTSNKTNNHYGILNQVEYLRGQIEGFFNKKEKEINKSVK